MALSLSTKSTALSISSAKSFSRLFSLRLQSTLPSHPNHTDLSDDSSTDPLLRKLEDAIHRIIVRRAAPDWLPFIPGSSYWVPPPRSAHGSNGIAQLIEKLAHPLTDEETLSTTTIRGWPSSDYFIKGVPLHPANVKTSSFKSDPKSPLNKEEAEASSSKPEANASSDKTEIVDTSKNVSKSEDEEG